MSVAYEQKASPALQQLGLGVAEEQLDQAAHRPLPQAGLAPISLAICSMPRCASATRRR